MGTTAQKLEYLGTTKSQLKTMISYGYPLSNETFRQYVGGVFKALINSMSNTLNPTWNNLPKISTTTSTSQSINNTIEAPMRIELGSTELTQDATPTPTSPQAIHTITGENNIKVVGKNLFDEIFRQGNQSSTTTGNRIINNTNILLEANKTYTISTNLSNAYKFAITLNTQELPTSNTNFYDSGWITNGTKTITPTQNGYIGILVCKSNGTDTLTPDDMASFNWQLEVGSATTYEPYKGNSYEVNLKSKNLFNANVITKNAYVVDQIITITASATDTYIQGGSTYSDTNKFLTLQAGTYYLKSTKSNVRVQLYGDNATLDTSSTQPITLSSTTNFGGIRIRSTDSSSLTNVSFGIILAKTNIDFEKYYDYGEYCKIGNYEDEFIRTSGKNLFEQLFIEAPNDNNKNAHLKAGTYTIATCDNQNFGTNVYFKLFNGNTAITTSGHFTSSNAQINFSSSSYNYYGGNGASYITFTIDNDYTIAIGLLNTTGTRQVVLVSGTTANRTFEPYGKNEWWLKKAIGKYHFTGLTTDGESWQYKGTTNERSVFQWSGGLPDKLNTSTNLPILCNYFPQCTIVQTDGYSVDEGIANGIYNGYAIKIITKQASDLATFKTWLGTHNTVVYYQLANSTYTQITGTLANQLENVYNSQSQDGTTNVLQINDDLSFNMSVSALEDLS